MKIVVLIWFELYKEVLLSSVIIGMYILFYDLAIISISHICVKNKVYHSNGRYCLKVIGYKVNYFTYNRKKKARGGEVCPYYQLKMI